ncbi:hypothetical protein Cadr_000008486 [Camelus dromedarius]|uniref:Uncharacterized protein n=1 Tax=Camelus dromedarius TaxID=9838 RepID=A0A5N4E197_CAMDR|nr:hypothetical protein Cadr_000008486 [Camelus dromedarius]
MISDSINKGKKSMDKAYLVLDLANFEANHLLSSLKHCPVNMQFSLKIPYERQLGEFGDEPILQAVGVLVRDISQAHNFLS